MKIFFAGNFPQMKDPELEKGMCDTVIEYHNVYRRLVSFYFKDDIQSVIDLKGEENETT